VAENHRIRDPGVRGTQDQRGRGSEDQGSEDQGSEGQGSGGQRNSGSEGQRIRG
jgi:hypothetical protein